MSDERFEWLEIPSENYINSTPAKKEKDSPYLIRGKRCPKCNWLERNDALECFRCGYNFALQTIYDKFEGFEHFQLSHKNIIFETLPKGIFTRKYLDKNEAYSLRLEAEHISLAEGFDKLICLNEIEIEHYEHQLQTALLALREMRGRVLLADEVGLGKTIEAGLIMKELIMRGLVKKILILVPASLVRQWHEEMEYKFGENFIIGTNKTDWVNEDRVIASIDTAKQLRYAREIHKLEYDLLIVDEAHKLKNRATKVYKFINMIRKKYVLMLTATPVHNDLAELYSLITILKPGLLGTLRRFRKRFVSPTDKRIPVNRKDLKELLKEVMIRNRRDTVDIRLPHRRAAVYHLQASKEEMNLYNQVTKYIKEEFAKEISRPYRQLALITLQKELASTPNALAGTLKKMMQKEEYTSLTKKKLEKFYKLTQKIHINRKTRAVLELLQKFPTKFLIYTTFRETMWTLEKYLKEHNYKVIIFHGGMTMNQKRQAIHNFEDDAQVMISTDAGAEGQNLQFCNILINYDLPWNPMRVEQRIGRLHRLGQKNDVTIFNLTLIDTIEADILDLLVKKIRMFELVIGEMDLILGLMEDENSFENAIRDIILTSHNRQEEKTRLEKLGDELIEARKQFEELQEVERNISDVFIEE